MKLIPKLQTAWQPIVADNTRVARQPVVQPIKRKLQPGEFLWTNANGTKTILRGKNAQVSKDVRNDRQKQQDKTSAPAERKRRQLKEAEQKTAVVASEALRRTMPSTIARAAYDAATGSKSFAGSMIEGNEGLGNETANLAFDAFSPFALNKGFQLVSKYGPRLARFGVSNYTGNWTQFGNNMYRLKPGYVGMNGMPVERQNVTQNLLKWLNKPEGYIPYKPLSPNSSFTNPSYNALLEEFKKAGVDVSKLDTEDIPLALGKRVQEVKNSAPERYTLFRGQHALDDYTGKIPVGHSDIEILPNGDTRMKMVYNLTGNPQIGTSNTVHGVYERGLNSAIQVSKDVGGNGVISGEELISANTQYPILRKFKDRETISYIGQHSNTNNVTAYRAANGIYDDGMETPANSMLELARAGNKERKILFNAPVWKLKKPTFHVPLKSDVFDPTIIDKFGDMHIDWSKGASMLKSVATPTILGTTALNYQQNQ